MKYKKELLTDKQIYMKKRVEIWKKLDFEPSLFLNEIELSKYEANRIELLNELRFVNSMLESLEKLLKTV